jgi:hypothetical protein
MHDFPVPFLDERKGRVKNPTGFDDEDNAEVMQKLIARSVAERFTAPPFGSRHRGREDRAPGHCGV